MTTIADLIKRDQENINKYKIGEITEDEFQCVAEVVASDFFDQYKRYGFPRKSAKPSLYKDAVALTLHLPLEKLEEVYNFLVSQPERYIDPKDLSFIVDKIRVNKKQPQIYGTQFKKNGDGTIEFLPIEEEGEVDARRSQIGLEPLEEYRKYAELI